MLYRFHCPQVGKYRLEIIIGKILVGSERHDRIQLSRPHEARAHDLQEQSLVVVSDARRIRGDVGRGGFSPRTSDQRPACILEPGDRLASLLWRVADSATADGHEVLAVLHAIS